MAIPTHYEALSRYLGEHVDAEDAALNSYSALIKDRGDDVVSYIIRMILADETRHHQIFTEMQNSLESQLRWSDVEPRVPSNRPEPELLPELLDATERLLELERADAKELKALRTSWKKQKGEREFWSLLVEVAELDTEKHIRMLTYVKKLVKEALRNQ